VKSFKEQPDMWYGFAGCTSWSNGDEPVYCEINDCLIIADSESVNVFAGEEGDENLVINLAFPNQKCAIAFLTGLPDDDFKPEDFGAEPF